MTYWDELTRAVTVPSRQVMLLASEGEDVVGSAYGLLDPEQSDTGRVGGMWVDPAWRRRGIGRALLQELFGWARGHGLKRLGLWAPAHSPAAVSLYSRAGFRRTGQRRQMPTNSSLWVVSMETDL